MDGLDKDHQQKKVFLFQVSCVSHEINIRKEQIGPHKYSGSLNSGC